MLKVERHSSELLLQILQRFNRYSRKVEQIHSLLITDGHLLISDQWINTLLYNTLIRAYLNLSRPKTTLLLFINMLHHQAPPNSHTFPSLLKATISLLQSYRTSHLGYSFNAQCVKRGLLNDPFVGTSFLSLYSQIGDMISARKMFDEIPQPCIVSYNAMLDAYAKSGGMGLAISMFSNMPKKDVYTWTSVINGYVRNGCFREAISFFRGNDGRLGMKQIHGYIVRNEKKLSVFIGTALIAFYGKTACLSYAFKVFNAMALKEICTWNAMICSMASNGMERQALDMFQMMKARSLHPNEVTFVGVLSACARTELVDFGLELFQSMSRDFAIIPTMEHYGCVVDLLGRAGLLREAFEFVRSMPFEADASVLGALLGACRVHGAVELGKEVGRRLLKLQPYHCGRYVLLSSIYAGAEIWDHAAALRSEMVHAGIQKVPAFSMT
ncbi:hypothetical protein ACJIZ3_004312 [Penstemon smallii]|uniref:Pentatricopeptide repeat-containing protein n=1 Tax=Penstemon smallii TaxID=265156 RepID=A0ABD3S1V2_9LAMI